MALLKCREAAMGHELDCPQQFGIWEVAGLGLVVAFRGTASQEDVLIDMNIEAVPLDASSASPRGALGTPLGLSAETMKVRQQIRVA
jgi:hypothetical protein